MEHYERLYEVLQRAAAQWRDELSAFPKTGIEDVLHDLCKVNKDDDAAGFLWDGN